MSEVGIERTVSVAGSTPEDWARQASAWKELGATHLSVNAALAGFTSVGQHINTLRRFKEAVG